MFTGDKYITRGVSQLSPWIPEKVYALIKEASKKVELDYLQVFELKSVKDPELVDNYFTTITHTQEQPDYMFQICVNSNEAVNEKLFCIDSDTFHTLLKASEY
ncbi:DUF960 family protein [Mycoplasmatota bacterium WC44]